MEGLVLARLLQAHRSNVLVAVEDQPLQAEQLELQVGVGVLAVLIKTSLVFQEPQILAEVVALEVVPMLYPQHAAEAEPAALV